MKFLVFLFLSVIFASVASEVYHAEQRMHGSARERNVEDGSTVKSANSGVLHVGEYIQVVVASPAEKCRDDEYNPGPNCGLEPTCAARSSHAYPKHTCDCWCKPGTYRVIESNECVTSTNCH